MSGISRIIRLLIFVLLAILDVKYLVQCAIVKLNIPAGSGNHTVHLRFGHVPVIDGPTNPLVMPRDSSNDVSDVCGYSNIEPVQRKEGPVPNEFPWLGALFQFEPKTYLCTVNLITTKHVLTAAHCMVLGTEVNKYQVVIGNQQSEPHQMTDIADITIHPEYMKTTAGHDLAILTLNTPMKISASVRPVCLLAPTRRSGIVSGIVAGFEPNYTTLNQMNLRVVTKSKCRNLYKNNSYLIKDNIFCAVGLSSSVGHCRGDSGAGFLHYTNGRAYLIGVVSTSHTNNGTCNMSEYVLFASLKNDLEWLRNSLQEFL